MPRPASARALCWAWGWIHALLHGCMGGSGPKLALDARVRRRRTCAARRARGSGPASWAPALFCVSCSTATSARRRTRTGLRHARGAPTTRPVLRNSVALGSVNSDPLGLWKFKLTWDPRDNTLFLAFFRDPMDPRPYFLARGGELR